MLTPLEILQWLLTHCVKLTVQHGNARDHKNKVILEYFGQDGEILAVGAMTISAAVCKACALGEERNKRAREEFRAANFKTLKTRTSPQGAS